ncbi:acylneuraminate cytidylyltransferase [Flavobacterium gilvum]|uniref:N-acylneuraminate cytidylyltransferase n=1 Tax=Flavobacterium gilvum TaxID=1492737 RepID=A0AAC9N4N0_9FLAO|nr:acylneuraminate cytidylyltransferase [Flavobacterium gilvum]AOW08127.1 cytidyltransferase [Flavobacterium gilvum]KFC58911.1 cytidyltransferase [Flavobacterium gilvum]
MKKIAILPLRKDSKGIIGKNKKKMVGRPLFSWVLSEAIFSELDQVYVFTDDIEIVTFIEKEYTWSTKVIPLLRSKENATDTASTESAMIEFADKVGYNFDVICLLQATSPYTTAKDINAVLESIEGGEDSALTVVKTHRFVWNANGEAQNYNVFNRPRRQDFEGLLIENGAVYATTKESFMTSQCRISGSIGIVKMAEESLIEIDSNSDWGVVESLLIERQKKQKQQQKIEYLVLDVDGVFTDGCVTYGKEGELSKKFDMRDGMGLEILRQNGIDVVVITSENSELVKQRMNKLQIKNAYYGVKDKFSFLNYFVKEQNTSFGALAYVGDDVNDLASMCSVSWSFAPANATDIIKLHSDFVLSKSSGGGAIREVCELIMKYNKRYE